MDDAKARPELLVQVTEVQPGTARFDTVLGLAARVLAQDRHLTSGFPAAQESHVLGAFDGSRCVGFLRYLIQVIGAEEGRPAVMHNGAPLREGFVEAFGVEPQLRRRSIGTALQQHAARQCRVLSDAISQPGDKRRELRIEGRSRVRAAPQPRKRLLLFPATPVTN